jgi:thioredoxin-like negative regulator of GroEL
MQRLTTFIRNTAMALVVAAVPAAAAAPPDIPWQTRFEPAAALSRETGKPIFIEFWATWCEVCQGMDADVYSDPDVVRAMTKVLPVRIDVDREPGMARRYGASATPTFVLADAVGNELFRFTGRIDRAPLLELLHELPADITRINRLAKALAADTSDLPTLDALAGELRRASLYVASTRYYERAAQTEEARRNKGVHGRLLASIGENYAALKRPGEAVAAFEKALRDVRGLPEEPNVMLNLARAQIAKGRSSDARATLDDLRQRFKGTPEAAAAEQLLPGGR